SLAKWSSSGRRTVGHLDIRSRSFPPRHDLFGQVSPSFSPLIATVGAKLIAIKLTCEPAGDGRQHPPGMAAWDLRLGIRTRNSAHAY
ncbi:hypothetical protein M5D96_004646, partial [Drosophila gunungcola]